MGQAQSGKNDAAQEQASGSRSFFFERLPETKHGCRQDDLACQLCIPAPIDILHGQGRNQAGDEHHGYPGPTVPEYPQGQGVEGDDCQDIEHLTGVEDCLGQIQGGNPMQDGCRSVETEVVSEGRQVSIGLPGIE